MGDFFFLFSKYYLNILTAIILIFFCFIIKICNCRSLRVYDFVSDVCNLLSSSSQAPVSLPISYIKGWKCPIWTSQPTSQPVLVMTHSWPMRSKGKPGGLQLQKSFLPYNVRPIKKTLFAFVLLLHLFASEDWFWKVWSWNITILKYHQLFAEGRIEWQKDPWY